MNQLLLGSGLGFAAAAVWYACARTRPGMAWFVVTPLLMAGGAAWAVVPDLPRLVGMTDLYLEWSREPAMDLFFWHYSIDLMEADSPWYAVGMVLMYAAVMGAAWVELARRERAVAWPT